MFLHDCLKDKGNRSMKMCRTLVISCGLLFCLFFAACTANVAEEAPTATGTIKAEATETAVATNTPVPPTETPLLPTATPPDVPATAVSDIIFQDASLGLSLSYPGDWQQANIGKHVLLTEKERDLTMDAFSADGAIVYLLHHPVRKIDSIGFDPQLESLNAMFDWELSSSLLEDAKEAIVYEDWGWQTVVEVNNENGEPSQISIAFHFGQEGFGAIFVGIAPLADGANYGDIFADMITSIQVSMPVEAVDTITNVFDPNHVEGALADGVLANGRISAQGTSFWQFEGQRDQLISAWLTPTMPHGDVAFQLFDAQGEPVGDAPIDSFFGRETINDFPLPTDGTYYLGVSSVDQEPGTFDLQLEIEPAAIFAHFEQPVRRQGIQFSSDEVLGRPVWFIPPDDEYTVATFAFAQPEDDENPTSICRTMGCVSIYDAQRYADAFEGFAYNVELMQTAIANGQLGGFPTVGAAVLMKSQVRPLTFQNGSGFRGIVTRGQDSYLANNESIVYDFHGLTDDGKYYIRARFPVDWAYLMDSYLPESNTNEDAILPTNLDPDSLDGNRANMMAYNQALEPLMDDAPNSEFTPNLSLLDTLVESILVDITD